MDKIVNLHWIQKRNASVHLYNVDEKIIFFFFVEWDSSGFI